MFFFADAKIIAPTRSVFESFSAVHMYPIVSLNFRGFFVDGSRLEDWIIEYDVSVFKIFLIRPSTRIRIRVGSNKFHSGERFQTFRDTSEKYSGYIWTRAVFVKKKFAEAQIFGYVWAGP